VGAEFSTQLMSSSRSPSAVLAALCATMELSADAARRRALLLSVTPGEEGEGDAGCEQTGDEGWPRKDDWTAAAAAATSAAGDDTCGLWSCLAALSLLLLLVSCCCWMCRADASRTRVEVAAAGAADLGAALTTEAAVVEVEG
jgi:hypothetical protein